MTGVAGAIAGWFGMSRKQDPEPPPYIDIEQTAGPQTGEAKLVEYTRICNAGVAHLVDVETSKAFVRIRSEGALDMTYREVKWMHEFLGDFLEVYEDVAIPEET